MVVPPASDETKRPGETTLRRQSTHLETASSLIQAIHGTISLGDLFDTLVINLVEVGGFVGAELIIDATVDNLSLAHRARAGVITRDDLVAIETSLFIRGYELGKLSTFTMVARLDDQTELLEFVLPTLFLAIDHAVSFAEVLDYRATLEARVVERTAELAKAREELERSFAELQQVKASRDRFFANINHEIRTPLTMIQLAADGISRTPALASTARQYVEEVNAASRRLLHLVDSLLVLAAGDEGKLRVRPTTFDIAAALQRLVRSWGTTAAQKQIELVYEGPDECTGTIDETALDTIIGNLVSNAMKFTAHGQIRVLLAAKADTVTLGVRDSGPGIDPDFIPKLFSRFERSPSAVEKGVRGTGIGLSLAKELVELQGGTIEVVRHEGTPADPHGTTFNVTLPRHQAISAALDPVPFKVVAYEDSEPVREPAPPRDAPGATILLAEDDEGLAHHITQILSQYYRVITAPNGVVALELAKKHVPDLLVTDLEMPEMDGFELTRRFLAQQSSSLAPVLIVSAHSRLGERLAGFDAGAVDYVTKPFSADELLARIRSQLAIRSLALKLHETQKLAAMGMLSSGLAHELRNPANALVNALEPFYSLLPLSQRAADSPGSALFSVMDAAATQIRDLCKNILEFSRSGGVSKKGEDVRVLLRRALLVLKDRFDVVELVEDLRVTERVRCSGPLIEQILINLLDNAAFAAGSGGTVFVSARTTGAVFQLDVSDSGPGVPADLGERIFDPFFTTKPPGQGTGLGLSVSRRIALNHGGDLRIVRDGERSLFRLELPV
ncbi:MAG: ATP-binding protein [Deltaproteobacteria bacterium]